MEKDILKGDLGPEAKYDVCFKEGKLCAEVSYVGKQAEAGVVIKIGAAQVIDAIAAAIPGTIDDAILNLAKGLLAG